MRRVILFVDTTLDGFMGGPAGELDWMVDTPKVVFSNTLEDVGMRNSRLAAGGIAEEVARLKQEPGKDLVIFGGASTVQAFVKLGLIDEYRMKVHPVAIGDGLPVFTDLEGKLNLTLVRSKAYGSGVLGLYYAPDRRP